MTAPGTEALSHLLRDEKVARGVLTAIHREAKSLPTVRLMEVCGTHTVVIRRSGIPSLLPDNIILHSGPGCPVCVTPNAVVDRAVALARRAEVVLATFGDMLRVPGSSSSLATERTLGADVRVVYSPLDALNLARDLPKKQVVFLGIGFETTAPTVAAAVLRACDRPANFSVLVAHKLVPPALEALCDSPEFLVDGFICPGHVSTIIGSDAYRSLAEKRGVACVVAGFEPVDVLLAVLMLLRQIRGRVSRVEVEYRTAVRPEGNRQALELMERVFGPVESQWRGLGRVPASGLQLRPQYQHLDARQRIHVEVEPLQEPEGCLCGQILVGAARPPQCGLFGTQCTPAHPVGPCMVSSEGTCAAYFKYEPEPGA